MTDDRLASDSVVVVVVFGTTNYRRDRALDEDEHEAQAEAQTSSPKLELRESPASA